MLPDKFYPLLTENILYFYTSNEKVTAYTSDGRQHPIDKTLDTLSEQLDGQLFFRANRQFIISRKAIKDIDLWFGSRLSVNLIIPIPERIIISKTKTPLLKKWILAIIALFILGIIIINLVTVRKTKDISTGNTSDWLNQGK